MSVASARARLPRGGSRAGSGVEAAEHRRRLRDLVAGARYEVLPLGDIVEEVRTHVPRDVTLTVTASPKHGLEQTLEVTEALAGLGYAVVPHMSARLVRDEAHLRETVARLGSAGVTEVFVIGGDAETPAGPYAEAAALLTAMGELRGAFREIGISGYPESHNLISDEDTIRSMTEKVPMATQIVSQVCFDAATIADWVGLVRARGTRLPIWVGVPGSVDQRKLLRISMRIGLGESARFLTAHKDWLRRLAFTRRYTPTRLLEDLVARLPDPAAGVAGIHVYTFNDVEQTERWRRELLARFALPA